MTEAYSQKLYRDLARDEAQQARTSICDEGVYAALARAEL